MHSPFFIVGPTAVGKTAVAVAIAERCGAEIVSADAFQVYAGLDLLTAKPSLQERERVTHHLVGTVPLSENYNVARFLQESRRCLDDAERRGRSVLVVGGSGMYVKALTHGLSPLPPAQPDLRDGLNALDLGELLSRLRAVDPVTANGIDTGNKRRLVRALEVCLVTGRPFSDFREEWKRTPGPVAPRGVLLVRPKPELDARIGCRVEAMFARGVVDEVQAARAELVGETASRMIGWREVQAHLDARLELDACTEKIVTVTRQYAKRQMTWFRSEDVFEEIVLPDQDDTLDTVAQICDRLKSQPH